MRPAKSTARRLWSMFGQPEQEAARPQPNGSSDAGLIRPVDAEQRTAWPRVEPVAETIRIELDGRTLVRTSSAVRIVGVGQSAGASMEPDQPVYFLPARDVDMNRLHPSDREGRSGWGGRIAYFHLIGSRGLIRDAVWFHPDPRPDLAAIRLHLAFFARAVDEVWVGRQRVLPDADAPQGGWVLPRETAPVRFV